MLSVIPLPYKILAAVVMAGALYGVGYIKGKDASRADNLQDQLDAVTQRLAENKADLAAQRKISENLRSTKNAELTKVRSALTAERLRIGSRSCPGTGAPEAPGASGSDEPDTGGRLLSAEMEGRIKRLIEETEEVAATGRTCQGFIIKNEMAP